MALFTLDQVLFATGGQLLVSGPQLRFSGISTDTRTLQPGELFVAIRGEQFNGHRFIEEAQAKGAAGALVEESLPGVRPRHTAFGDWCVIEVTDTLYALGQLARAHRRRFSLPVIGITGSAGKTTTKEMTAAILEQGRRVLKSEGNFNNEIGLPRTLFNLTGEHQAAVLEFGMRGRGQIGYLASISRPTVGLITNIGLTHLELLGSQEEIALAKAELLDEMPAHSTAVLPKDDVFYPLLAEHAQGPVVTVGEHEDCDLWMSKSMLAEDGCARFILTWRGEHFPVHLAMPGRHQARNAMLAAAAALAVGASVSDVQQGLAALQPTTGRMQRLVSPRGITILDDTYNANPAAVRATLEVLAEGKGGRKVAILGDMRELGPAAGELHRDIGRYAMTLGLDALLAVGELGREYVTGAADARAQWHPDNAAAAEAARALLRPGDTVLVKGSRAMRMEEIVAALLREDG